MQTSLECSFPSIPKVTLNPRFKALVKDYYQKSVLSQLPASYANIEEPEMGNKLICL